MKKICLCILTVVVAFLVYMNVNAEVNYIEIPEAAIRVRVIANSNSIYDQSMKMKVEEYIEKTISPMLVDVDSVDDARKIISSQTSILEEEIAELFEENGYEEEFVIHFGDNYFPEKEYKGTYYEAGAYESLVVSIGEGEGDNWWCVLFPPLCLLEASESDTDEVQYRFFVQEMLDKIFQS